MNELISELGINPLLLGAQAVNFLLLLFILTKFLYKPIIKLLDTRTKKIEQSLKKAEQIEKDAQASQEAFDKKMVQAKTEANTIIAESKQEAEKVRTEMLEKTQEQTLEMTEKARASLRHERDTLTQELRDETAQLVVKATSKILQQEIDNEKQQEIAKKIIKDLP